MPRKKKENNENMNGEKVVQNKPKKKNIKKNKSLNELKPSNTNYENEFNKLKDKYVEMCKVIYDLQLQLNEKDKEREELLKEIRNLQNSNFPNLNFGNILGNELISNNDILLNTDLINEESIKLSIKKPLRMTDMETDDSESEDDLSCNDSNSSDSNC